MNKLNRIASDIEDVTSSLVKVAIEQSVQDDIMSLNATDLALMQTFYGLTQLFNEYLQEEARVLTKIEEDIERLEKS